jgi:hypothetical protein
MIDESLASMIDEAPENVDDIVCKVCSKSDDDDKLLLCDNCDQGTHMYCASPPLESIPQDDWVLMFIFYF